MKKIFIYNALLILLIICSLIFIFLNFTPLIGLGGDDAVKYGFGKRFTFEDTNYRSWHHYYRWASWMFAKIGIIITNDNVLSYFLSSYISSLAFLLLCIFILNFFSPILSLFFFLLIITDKNILYQIFQLSVQTTALIPFSILLIFLTKIKVDNVNNLKIFVVSILIFVLYANKLSISFFVIGLFVYLLISKKISLIKKILAILITLYFFESIFFYIYFENTTLFGKIINLIKNENHIVNLKKNSYWYLTLNEYLQVLFNTWTKSNRLLAILSIFFVFLFVNKEKQNKNNFLILSYLLLADIFLKSISIIFFDGNIIFVEPLHARNLILTDILCLYVLLVFTNNMIIDNKIFFLNYIVLLILIFNNIISLKLYTSRFTDKYETQSNIYKNIVKAVSKADCIYFDKYQHIYLFNEIYDYEIKHTKKSNYYQILNGSKNSNCNNTYYLEEYFYNR